MQNFDKEIGFWIKGVPYVWLPRSYREQCGRIYLTMQDTAAGFNENNEIESVHDMIINATHDVAPDPLMRGPGFADANYLCILPLGGMMCNFVRNCFLISKLPPESKYREVLDIRIEGQPAFISDLKSLSPMIEIIDPETGYTKYIKMHELKTHENQPIYTQKVPDVSVASLQEGSTSRSTAKLYTPPPLILRLVPNFLPTKVIYNKDSHRIAQKITKDTRKNISTKEMLESFYKTHSSDKEEVWSTNKTANAKYYEWFTKYTQNILVDYYVDFGCGSGKDAIVISQEINAVHTECADVKDSRVPTAKSLKFLLVKENEPLDLDSNTVSVMTVFHTIHHMKDAETRLRDIYRVLEPGGLLIIKDHNVKTKDDADNVTFEHFVYSIGEGEATVNDENTYKDILPMYYYSADNVDAYLRNMGFTRLSLNTYNNPTKTYNAVYKK